MLTASPTARSLAEALNRSARRILQASKQAEWNSAVLDAAAEFCGEAALFSAQGGQLRLEKATLAGLAPDMMIPLAEAPALADAIGSREPVAAAWSARELSAALVERASGIGAGRVHLFPIASSGRAVALLMAAGGEVDANGLELVSSLAGAAWELRLPRNDGVARASTELVMLGTPPASATAKGVGAENGPEQELRRRARRYASVKVAEWRLYESAKVARGRTDKNLYGLFQEEIDRERARFQKVFMEKDPGMADYLHEEMIRTLAQGRADQMGENYPGAMQLA